jgi:DNA-binding transcriptional LysR family regulator
VGFCIIAMELTDPALEGCVLRRQEIGCVVSSLNPLASRASVTLAELAGLHFTAYPPGNTQRELFNEMFASKGLFPAVTFECESFYEMLRTVVADSTGRFAATMVRRVYENYHPESTRFLPITDADIDPSLRLYWLREKPGAVDRPLVSTVREVIRAYFNTA